jgi:hypothetical protein
VIDGAGRDHETGVGDDALYNEQDPPLGWSRKWPFLLTRNS